MYRIELKVPEKIIIETLSRIGIGNKKSKELFPTAYLYYDENKEPFIAHFKEILEIRENGFDNMTDEDYDRLDNITDLLMEWTLIEEFDLEEFNHKKLFILPFNDKKEWKIKHKVRISY